MKKNLTKKIKYLASGDTFVPVELVEDHDVIIPEVNSLYAENQARLENTRELLESYNPSRKELHEWFQKKHPAMYHAARSLRQRESNGQYNVNLFDKNGIEKVGTPLWYPGQNIIARIGVAHKGKDADAMLHAIDRYSFMVESGMSPTEAFNKLSDVDRNQLSFFFDLSY